MMGVSEKDEFCQDLAFLKKEPRTYKDYYPFTR